MTYNNDPHGREQEPLESISRRDLLLRGGLVAAGGAIGGIVVDEAIHAATRAPELHPLEPENGEAESKLDIFWMPDTVTRWKSDIEEISGDYKVDPNLTAIIMLIESAGKPDYDDGMMQVTPKTQEDIAAKYLKKPTSNYDIKDPRTAIEFGVANLRRLIDKYGDENQGPSWVETVARVAAAYNGGTGGADVFIDGGNTMYERLNTVQEYNQGLHNYIRYAMRMWTERHDNKSFAFRFWIEPAFGNGQALVNEAQAYQR